MNWYEVHSVHVSPSGWKTAIVGMLVNDDFAAWLCHQGIWEIRSTDVLRAPWPIWRLLATCRTREDAEVTVAAIVEQMRATRPPSK